MLLNYYYYLLLFAANSIEMLMATGSGSLEEYEEPLLMFNLSLEEKPEKNYFTNEQEKQLFFQLTSIFLMKYTYEEYIKESDNILRDLIQTFFPSLAATPNFKEIFGKSTLKNIANIFKSKQKTLEKFIVEFVMRIKDIEDECKNNNLPKKEFDTKLEVKKFEKIIKLFKLTENDIEVPEKIFVNIWNKVNNKYYENMKSKVALFYYHSFWQIAMDYSDRQQEETSPIREWILDTLIPLMDKKLLLSHGNIGEDGLTFNLKILFRALHEEKSIKRQLDFAFRIAPKNRDECNQYCVNAISILKKKIENIRTTGAFYKIIDDLSNLPDKRAHVMTIYLPRCQNKAENETAKMGDKRENRVRKLFITFYECMIKSMIKFYYGSNIRVELNWQITFLKYLLQNMLGELVENKPAIHLELARYQIEASMLTDYLSLKLRNSFELWPFMENREELESELFRGILRIVQEKSQTITVEELIGKIKNENENARFGEYFASKNDLLKMLERVGIKTENATKNAMGLTKGIETICFLKYYYDEIIKAYKEKTVIRELLPDKVANLVWLEKLNKELYTIMANHLPDIDRESNKKWFTNQRYRQSKPKKKQFHKEQQQINVVDSMHGNGEEEASGSDHQMPVDHIETNYYQIPANGQPQALAEEQWTYQPQMNWLNQQHMDWHNDQQQPMYWHNDQQQPMYWHNDQQQPMYWHNNQQQPMYWHNDQQHMDWHNDQQQPMNWQNQQQPMYYWPNPQMSLDQQQYEQELMGQESDEDEETGDLPPAADKNQIDARRKGKAPMQ